MMRIASGKLERKNQAEDMRSDWKSRELDFLER